MSDTRALYRSRGTFMIGIPQHMVKRMGAVKGTQMLMEQPCSGGIIISPIVSGKHAMASNMTRQLGWMIGKLNPERDLALFGVGGEPSGDMCHCCGLWPQHRTVGQARLCVFCMKEFSCALWLRSQPAQVELQLKQASLTDGGLLENSQAISMTGDPGMTM